ncbi:phosphoserine aminotransferase isoform X2 [Leptinotarsa decemlineata]|uniref:phosphoserine aminotransferase isoform X2 n=1 Tax=Leptinotarsa decemlineata TaxID=7539 RepID=UPI003D30D375
MVMKEVQNEFLSYQHCGMSMVEISHRSDEYNKINNNAQIVLRELLDIPPNYRILFMQGGGQGAFSAIPMNLMSKTGIADYVVTGTWSSVAAKEATKHGHVNIVTPKLDKTGSIPDQKTWKLNPNASYVFYCDNDTIDGVEFPFIPETGNVPLVADMCSNILTKKIDIAKFGLIFAASQKNLAPAGLAVIIIREDLLGNPVKYCPSILDFTLTNRMNSILNTPSMFSVYVMEKVLQWVKREGGLQVMENLSAQKSKLIYDAIDNSRSFYVSAVETAVRSRINVPFRVGGESSEEKLEKRFLEEAEELKMFQLKGHHLVGGIRASLYNSITLDEVRKLVDFMNNFRERFQNIS